ncbi:DUF547 domain-containing protein [Tamlana sp. s12]|uniref:DUF547 domain-containing protein n=1 Tax=Tamlana sp. s12 TaxID=1630406 RepID=UPI000838AE43|nr:DUF547 domain-containing protein [Tamlana sp. s12]QQY82621.1 DUF547 domain-containing protein [Tamlana sp. s12]
MNFKIKLTSILFLICTCWGYSQTIDNSDLKTFLKKHVSEEGFVNYDKLVRNKESLDDIVMGLSKISPTSTWSSNEVKAYWINVYNINVLKLVSSYYPLKSIKYIDKPFQVDFISVEGKKVSLDYIENTIMKGLEDPRIYFTLNNTCVSAPSLNREPYTAENLELQLETAVKAFVNDTSKNYFSNTTNEAIISPIFKWHASEFKNLITFINNYLENKQITEQTKLTYSSFDWTLNKETY